MDGAPQYAQSDIEAQKSGFAAPRIPRSNRACEVCHQRKVRCDVSTRGTPCTNCAAFSLDCRIRVHKQRAGTDGGPSTEHYASQQFQTISPEPGEPFVTPQSGHDALHAAGINTLQNGPDAMDVTYTTVPLPALNDSNPLRMLQPFLEQSFDLDEQELSFLHQRGAFLLPPRNLCNELVDAFFTWVAPIVPCVNETEFRRQYSRDDRSVSILLLQAMLLAGSKVCTSSELHDENGTTYSASSIFYRRAKALYDAHYEDDIDTIIQALILMSWSEEGPDDVTKNVFYWSSLAITVAMDANYHRTVEDPELGLSDEDARKARKRLWWTLFSRDRSIARSIGRPVQINADEISIEMATEDDFIEDERQFFELPSAHQERIQFFLAYTRLSYVTGLVLSEDYVAKTRPNKAFGYAYLDMKLADWLQECPQTLGWSKENHTFLSALLAANYWTTVCLLQRRQVETEASLMAEGMTRLPNALTSMAAGMIVSILEKLQDNGELRRAPSFTIYIAFSALAVLGPELRSGNSSKQAATQKSIDTCMRALKKMSVSWLTAKMVHSFFLSTLSK